MVKRKLVNQFIHYNYYLGGVVSVLGKIEAAFGVKTSAAIAAIGHVKASMRDKYYARKDGIHRPRRNKSRRV